MPRHLEDQMTGGSKPRQAKAFSVAKACKPQGAVSDRAGAKQGRGFGVVEGLRNRVGEGRPEREVFRVAAVDVAAGGPELRTQVLPARKTKLARPAGGGDPSDADPIPLPVAFRPPAQLLHPPNHLMPEHDR